MAELAGATEFEAAPLRNTKERSASDVPLIEWLEIPVSETWSSELARDIGGGSRGVKRWNCFIVPRLLEATRLWPINR